MKKFRKIMAVLVAAVLMISSFTLTAFAATYTITIDNALVGETYKAYKIFDATYASDGTTFVKTLDTNVDTSKHYYKKESKEYPGGTYDEYVPAEGLTNNTAVSTLEYDLYELRDKVAYTIDTSVTPNWHSIISSEPGLTFEPSANDANIKVVTFNENTFNPRHFAKTLKDALDGNAITPSVAGSATPTGTANGVTTKSTDITVSEPGYYFIDTTLGSLVALDTTQPLATVHEKNVAPKVTKLISKDGTNYSGDAIDVNIGDPVYYKITVENGRGTDAEMIVHDVMDSGLTLDLSTLRVTGATLNTHYTIELNNTTEITNKDHIITGITRSSTAFTGNAAGDSFKVILKDTYVEPLADDATVVITYTAYLNETNALIYKDDADTLNLTNDNGARLEYSKQLTAWSEVNAKTFEFKIYKYDDSDATTNTYLDGVTFTLQNTSDKYYRNGVDTASGATDYTRTTQGIWQDSSNPIATADGGYITYRGLEAGTYELTETDTVNGFNLMTEAVTVEIDDDGSVKAYLKTTGEALGSLSVVPATSSTFAIVKIPNTPGKALPSTGGMGTTVLYIVGGMLVILAGAYLFFSRKKTA